MMYVKTGHLKDLVINELYKFGYKPVEEELYDGTELRFKLPQFDFKDFQNVRYLYDKYGVELIMVESYNGGVMVRLLVPKNV